RRAAGALRAGEACRRGSVRPPSQDAPQLALARGRRLAGRGGRGARRARPPRRRPRGGARSRRVRRARAAALVSAISAYAKINLALVVGPIRPDGKHEVTTVLQRIGLADRITVDPAASLRVEGFADDSLVRRALQSLAEAAGVEPTWAAGIEKQIPVAAGLGGGSSDAAAALRLANELLDEPLDAEQLRTLAAT